MLPSHPIGDSGQVARGSQSTNRTHTSTNDPTPRPTVAPDGSRPYDGDDDDDGLVAWRGGERVDGDDEEEAGDCSPTLLRPAPRRAEEEPAPNGRLIEAPCLVHGGHSASFRQTLGSPEGRRTPDHGLPMVTFGAAPEAARRPLGARRRSPPPLGAARLDSTAGE
jgi:hypothetical protein